MDQSPEEPDDATPTEMARRKLSSLWTLLEKKGKAALAQAHFNQGVTNLYLKWADLPADALLAKEI